MSATRIIRRSLGTSERTSAGLKKRAQARALRAMRLRQAAEHGFVRDGDAT